MKHRWGDKTIVTANKTERECLNGCGVVKVTRHETEGGRDLHWIEFWSGLDRVEGDRTPSCTAAVKYNARNYPL